MSTRKEFTRELYIKLYDAGNEGTKYWLLSKYSKVFSIHDIFALTSNRYKQLRVLATQEQNKLLDEAYGTVYNNWYINIKQPKSLLYITENDSVHGFNKGGEYITKTAIKINPLNSENLIQATEEQIKTIFLKECEKRGFTKGAKYRVKGRKKTNEIEGTLAVYIKKDNRLQITDGYGGSVYYKGVWASIVREKTYEMGQKIKTAISQNEYMITQLNNGSISLVNLQNGYIHYRTVYVNNKDRITKKEIETLIYEDFVLIS